MIILSTSIYICMLLYHILKLLVSINVNFKYYWSPKTGIPFEYTAEAQHFIKDAFHK